MQIKRRRPTYTVWSHQNKPYNQTLYLALSEFNKTWFCKQLCPGSRSTWTLTEGLPLSILWWTACPTHRPQNIPLSWIKTYCSILQSLCNDHSLSICLTLGQWVLHHRIHQYASKCCKGPIKVVQWCTVMNKACVYKNAGRGCMNIYMWSGFERLKVEIAWAVFCI